MVAPTKPHNPSRTAEVPRSLLSGRGALVRFTVDDVLSMIRQGILPEDSTTELLDGLVLLKDRSDLGGDPRMHGPKHRLCVRLLTSLAGRVETDNRHAQIQSPIVCGEAQMPEPDFALVRGKDRDYADRLPRAADTLLVIEAADSSLERDSEDKLPIYAAAGIPHYLIINLRNATIDHFSNPNPLSATYRTRISVTRDGSILLHVGPDGDIQLAAAEVLP